MARALHKSLCAALWIISGCILIIWARSNLVADSYRRVDVYESDSSTKQVRTDIYCGSGGVGITRDEVGTNNPARIARMRARLTQRATAFNPGYTRSDDPHYPARVGSTDGWLAAFGIYYRVDDQARAGFLYHQLAVTVPLWMFFVLTAVYPLTRYVVQVVRQQRAERIALGMCPRCECDVRGKLRCPVCGKPIKEISTNGKTKPVRVAA